MSWRNTRVRPGAPRADRPDELPGPGTKPIVSDAEQRAARHVADPGRLDHEGAGLAVGEAAVPVEHLAA